MTQVFYYDGKRKQEMNLSGHAGDTDVCTAISSISQTLMKNLEMEEAAGQVLADTEMKTPGEIRIKAWPVGESTDAIRKMFRFTVNGLKMVEDEYPQNISIREERENGII